MLLLDARSHFSLGESVVKIEALVAHAKEAGYTAVALCDTMNISGMIDFAKRCDEAGIKPVIGCRLRVVADPTYRKPKLGEPAKDNREFYPKVFIRNQAGWQAVMRLLSKGLSEEYFYYKARIGLADLLEELKGGDLIVTSGDFSGIFEHPDGQDIWQQIRLVCPHAFAEVVPVDTPYWDRIAHEAYKRGGKLLGSWPVLYLDEGDATARDVAATIMNNQKIADPWRQIPHTRCHKPVTEAALEGLLTEQAERIKTHYRGTPSAELALRGRAELQELIDFKWSRLPVSLPNIAVGETEFEMLMRLCKEGWKRRFGSPVLGYQPAPADLPRYQERLKYELQVIRKMGFERYFLVVQDLVNWAKGQGILVGPGRGSVGGSLVAYLTGITEVDPLRFNLLFERFINPERLDLPDADLDFQSSRREEVIQYLVTKYGRERVAGISNFTTMASASALRDVGRVFEIDPMELGVSKLVPDEHGKPYELNRAADEVPAIDAFRQKHKLVWDCATRLEGVMRSFGRHAAGVIVADEPISSRAVVETHRGEPVVNWDKVFVEDLGLVKMDVLGLSNLDVIGLALRYIKERHGTDLNMGALPLDDEKVLDAFAKGETVGVFQFESAGMRQLLKDLGAVAPLTFEDLSAATSLYRPGPKDSGLLDDYVAIKQGLKRPYYEHPNMRPALEETQGVMIYQESVMQITRDLCGFTAAEADAARKAMGKKDKDKMEKLRAKFVAGAEFHSGMPAAAASALFDKIMNFAAYGFNKSHACEYSVISYWTMYLKVYYPAEFYAATLTMLGEDKAEGLVRDARKRGIEVMPPRINYSTTRYEIISEGLKDHKAVLIAPLQAVKAVSERTSTEILKERKRGGVFKSLEDFESRLSGRTCNSRQREHLLKVGAFAKIMPGSLPALHPDRRKDQLTLMPGLIIDVVKSDRVIPVGDAIKDILIAEVIKPAIACKGCSLAGGAHPIPRLGAKPKFMVVTDCPNYSEEAANKMFSGKASDFLKLALKEAGLKPGDGYFTSLVKSPKSGKMLTNEQINGCAGYLRKELEILKPPIIVALGSATLRQLVPELKGGGQEHVGRVHYDPALDANVVIGFNPAMIAFDSGKQVALNELMKTVAELLE